MSSANLHRCNVARASNISHNPPLPPSLSLRFTCWGLSSVSVCCAVPRPGARRKTSCGELRSGPRDRGPVATIGGVPWPGASCDPNGAADGKTPRPESSRHRAINCQAKARRGAPAGAATGPCGWRQTGRVDGWRGATWQSCAWRRPAGAACVPGWWGKILPLAGESQ